MYRDPIANDTRPQCNNAADAQEQAAVTNILNRISGSNAQTNANMFGAMDSTGATGSVMNSAVNIGGTSIPLTYLMIGGGVLLLVLLVS